MLTWTCHDDAQPPTDSQLTVMCQELVRLQLVKVCRPPHGLAIHLPVVPPSK